MDTISLILILEILGTISFSISGAMFAIKNRLDLLGIITIALITTFGGGAMRDILIDSTPPRIFFGYKYIFLSILCSIIVFSIYKLQVDNFIRRKKTFLTKINVLFDSIGLGTFSVIGVSIILESSYSQNIFIAIFLGATTAVGGGLIRDALCNKIPFIFRPHEVYATASIVGSLIYYLLAQNGIDKIISSVLAIIIVLLIRIISLKYKLSLPDIRK